jgi:cytokinin dehydrogenase
MSRFEPRPDKLRNRLTGRTASRRHFLKISSACAITAGLGSLGLSGISKAKAQGVRPNEMPLIDGEYLVDEAARRSVATDYGLSVHRMPLAVVKPLTIEDVVRVISYANKRNLKVAMRGQAHSLSGQALVEDGILIDSSALKDVRFQTREALDAQPGAFWGDVARVALAHGRMPPVLPDAMVLSVGGTLSVGGIGETSHRFGAQVDHVSELDVVTGAGEFVTCSANRDSELFNMVLAGLGQCGFILRARLRLVTAPNSVVIRTLNYNDLATFLSDQARLTRAAALGPLNGRLSRNPQGSWQFSLSAGSFVADTNDGKDLPDWMTGLRHGSEAPPTTVQLWEYLDRRSASISAGKARKTPNPALVVTMPAASTKAFLDEVLASQELSAGIWFFEVSAKIPARHTQPLQKMPASDLAYELRMQRRASAIDAADHKAMLAANQLLVARVLEGGGKVYPPFAPILSQAQWQEHYGTETWRRFMAAKQRFDPNNVLTPGAGIF